LSALQVTSKVKGTVPSRTGALLQGIHDFSWPSLSRYLTTSVPFAPTHKAGAVLAPARVGFWSEHSVRSFYEFSWTTPSWAPHTTTDVVPSIPHCLPIMVHAERNVFSAVRASPPRKPIPHATASMSLHLTLHSGCIEYSLVFVLAGIFVLRKNYSRPFFAP
jgi:hypothetical protein